MPRSLCLRGWVRTGTCLLTFQQRWEVLLRLQSLCELLQSSVQPSAMLASPLHRRLEEGCSAAGFLSADRVWMHFAALLDDKRSATRSSLCQANAQSHVMASWAAAPVVLMPLMSSPCTELFWLLMLPSVHVEWQQGRATPPAALAPQGHWTLPPHTAHTQATSVLVSSEFR